MRRRPRLVCIRDQVALIRRSRIRPDRPRDTLPASLRIRRTARTATRARSSFGLPDLAAQLRYLPLSPSRRRLDPVAQCVYALFRHVHRPFHGLDLIGADRFLELGNLFLFGHLIPLTADGLTGTPFSPDRNCRSGTARRLTHASHAQTSPSPFTGY